MFEKVVFRIESKVITKKFIRGNPLTTNCLDTCIRQSPLKRTQVRKPKYRGLFKAVMVPFVFLNLD